MKFYTIIYEPILKKNRRGTIRVSALVDYLKKMFAVFAKIFIFALHSVDIIKKCKI